MSDQRGVVFHVTSGESADWRMALRNLSNLYDDSSVGTPTDLMNVVVNGDAVRFLLSSSPEATQVERLTDAGVQVNACASSLARHGYSPDELAVGVRTVPSGVAEVLRLQRHGDSYLKLP